MDSDLIKLVNRLQETFSNLGTPLPLPVNYHNNIFIGGELDMPQLVVVR